MKALIIVRLFSGLEKSVRERRWVPTGVPTIYRLIETLSREVHEPTVLLCAKDGHTTWNDDRDLDVRLDGLRARIRVIAGNAALKGLFRRLGALGREMRQFYYSVRILRDEKPDFVYIDHGNAWTAGLLARFTGVPVVFRVMGVYPAMRSALDGRRISQKILRWCYRAPFAAVICTQDGSGIEPWLKRSIRRDVPVFELLNGVDQITSDWLPNPVIAAIPKERIVVTFLGKLEATKGAIEFAEAFLQARSQNSQLHALMIGAGALQETIRESFRHCNETQNLTIIERLPHDQVIGALLRTDIYVSLNRFGNLSNANLEALRVGLCMIIPSSQPETGVDIPTDELLPASAVWRIKSAKDIAGLIHAILTLTEDRERRHEMASRVRAIASENIGSWSQRMNREVEILRAVAAGRCPT